MLLPALLAFIKYKINRSAPNQRDYFRNRLSLHERRLRDRRIRRVALLAPRLSAFAYLFGSGDDLSLITLTGLDHAIFRHLLDTFEPIYHQFSPYSEDGALRRLPQNAVRRGKPRDLDATGCLALALAWTRTRGSEYVLCMIFGVTVTPCSLFVRFGRRLLLRVLAGDYAVAVVMPSAEKISDYQQAVKAKYSLLDDVFCVADGLKLNLQQSGNNMVQNMFYNGWTLGHYVSSVLVFAPDGGIIACSINAPGSMHDSLVAEWGGVYKKLETAYERFGARCVVDSAFSKTDYPFLIKSAQDDVSIAANTVELLRLRQATSVRQAAEWGMRGFQSSFPRLKDDMAYEERGERRLILEMAILLLNFRAHRVGINQIRSTYMPVLEIEANDLFSINFL